MAPGKNPTANNTLRAVDLLHGDTRLGGPDVAPPISVSTTFSVPHPSELARFPDFNEVDPLADDNLLVYSRYNTNTSHRVEQILSKINNGYALTYATGLAAGYAAFVHIKPKRVAITDGYHGIHAGLEIYKRNSGNTVEIISIDEPFQEGDVCWLETPLNPTGEARDIQFYADKIHSVGGKLVVDSTFAPPPLQYPFDFGTDIVMHSGSKYFGGHSDLLSGVLITKTVDEWRQLWSDRTFLGSMLGSFESWLLLRSLRTLQLRVKRQSETATALVQWLEAAASSKEDYDGIPAGVISKVWHSSIQHKQGSNFDPSKQMPGGHGGTFSIFLSNEKYAAQLAYSTKYFAPATSLGGVESLMEQRVRSDSGADPRLVRLSIGLEDLEDLQEDLRHAFQHVVKLSAEL